MSAHRTQTARHPTVALLLEVDPVALVRGKSSSEDGFTLAQYVNDRPYAASNMVAVAEQRRGTIMAAIRSLGARSVGDFGCGESVLVRDLLAERSITRVVATRGPAAAGRAGQGPRRAPGGDCAGHTGIALRAAQRHPRGPGLQQPHDWQEGTPIGVHPAGRRPGLGGSCQHRRGVRVGPVHPECGDDPTGGLRANRTTNSRTCASIAGPPERQG